MNEEIRPQDRSLPNEEPQPLNEQEELRQLYDLARTHNPTAWYIPWSEEAVVYVEEARKSLLCAMADGLLRPAIHAMMSASGLTKEQAKTCVYYAVATFLQDEYQELVPILLFLGNSGTGKTTAMIQLEKLVDQPKWIQGRTYSDIGGSIDRAVTALIDEGDFKQLRVEKELLQLRACKRFANQIIHQPPDQKRLPIYNFGATVIARREPFSDTATRNRTITIKTKRRGGGNYHQVGIDNSGIRTMAENMKRYRSETNSSDRVSDAWRPITDIATTIGDAEWLGYQLGELRRAQQMLAAGDQYEPEDVLIKAILACCEGHFDRNIKLIAIKKILLENFDLKWSGQKVHAMVLSLGFTVRFYQGYDHLVANVDGIPAHDHLMALAQEKEIGWEEGR